VRVLVLSDIHANVTALDAVLEAAGAVDAVWQLGDVVGYGPDPDEVVARLRTIGATGVRGNHDAAALGDLGTEWFNTYARAAIDWTRRTIAPETRDWLAGLPERRDEGDLGLCHGSFRDPIWEYIHDPGIAEASLRILAAEDLAAGLFGHTHLPAIHRAEDGRVAGAVPPEGATLTLDERRVLLNPGSVGQPRDRIPTASFMLVDTERREATWQRAAYDIPTVQARMRRAGLPEPLALRLEHGL
jgi:diadenosine tetraphosphatase ApaH/serine/threonine PP2A family protein phosphatase